ncbi:MAG: YfbM family protein [Pirellula sp.]|nr:YfbM family protein [Pirellula sp.]
MSLGIHFALSSRDATRLLKYKDPDELFEFITEDLEEQYLENDKWSFQSDKAWDAIHRSLTDGKLLYESGPFPLAYAVLGGKPLDVGDEYTACFVDADQVVEVSNALVSVTKKWMQQRYNTLSKTDYGPVSPDDFDYTWEIFEGLRGFFSKAAKAGRAVLFTTDA